MDQEYRLRNLPLAVYPITNINEVTGIFTGRRMLWHGMTGRNHENPR
jgi:hypothetical protein